MIKINRNTWMTNYTTARIAIHVMKNLYICFLVNYYETGAGRMGKH